MLSTRAAPEGASTAQSSEFQSSSRSDVDMLQRQDSLETPGSDHTQIVVEVHPATHNDDFKVLGGDRDTVSGIRSSAPELCMVSSTAFDERVARTSETQRKRQFVVIAVADDVKRLTTHPGIHTTSAARRTRSGSCTLPTHVRSPTTSRRFVISLMNLDTGKFSSDAVLPQCRPFQPLSSTVASGCSPDQAASLTVAVEVSSTPRCAGATSDRGWREVSNELWSLRALLANHEDMDRLLSDLDLPTSDLDTSDLAQLVSDLDQLTSDLV